MQGNFRLRNEPGSMPAVPVIEFVYLIQVSNTIEAVTTRSDWYFQYAEVYPAKAVGTGASVGLLTANGADIFVGRSGVLAALTLTQLVVTAGVAKATKAAHGLVDGQSVVIAGATPSGLNGLVTVRKPTTDTFEFQPPTAGLADGPATGTITATKVSYTPDKGAAASTNTPIIYSLPLGQKQRVSDIIVRGTATDGAFIRFRP